MLVMRVSQNAGFTLQHSNLTLSYILCDCAYTFIAIVGGVAWHGFTPANTFQEPSVGAGIDGGGSVRVAAALCGVAALRPTVGRTSTAHCPPNAFSIMAFGVISGGLEDALLVYAAIGNAGMRPVCLTFRCVYFKSM